MTSRKSKSVAPCAFIDSTRFARPGEWPTTDGQHLTQDDKAGQGAQRRLKAHQRAEGPRRQAGQGEHLQRVGQGGAEHADRGAEQQGMGRQKGRARLRHADRNDDQRRGAHAQGRGLHAVRIAGLLSEHDIERPAHRRA